MTTQRYSRNRPAGLFRSPSLYVTDLSALGELELTLPVGTARASCAPYALLLPSLRRGFGSAMYWRMLRRASQILRCRYRDNAYANAIEVFWEN